MQFYKIWDFEIPTPWNDVIMEFINVFFLICLENLSKTTYSIETLQTDSLFKVLSNMQISKNHGTRNNDVITKNNGNNRKIGTSAKPNKIYIVAKVLLRAIQKCNFYWIWATVPNVMDIYVKFTITTHHK